MRYITPYILEDLKKKMVFVGGPRQVGKTTLARAVLSKNFPAERQFPEGAVSLLAPASFLYKIVAKSGAETSQDIFL